MIFKIEACVPQVIFPGVLTTLKCPVTVTAEHMTFAGPPRSANLQKGVVLSTRLLVSTAPYLGKGREKSTTGNTPWRSREGRADIPNWVPPLREVYQSESLPPSQTGTFPKPGSFLGLGFEMDTHHSFGHLFRLNLGWGKNKKKKSKSTGLHYGGNFQTTYTQTHKAGRGIGDSGPGGRWGAGGSPRRRTRPWTWPVPR